MRRGYTNDHAKQCLILYLSVFFHGLAFRLNLFCDLEVLWSGEVSLRRETASYGEHTLEGANLLLARIRGPYL